MEQITMLALLLLLGRMEFKFDKCCNIKVMDAKY